ncbi:MAG: aromatic ring-hydroxylating dioxygenase subunit alpha [Thermomicrobiales bacterium]
MRHNWQAGDYLTVEIDGESAIVVRGRDGAVRAFLNVCRHRGARLCSEPCGQLSGAIRCKYHAWTYALDGRLIGVPNMPGEGVGSGGARSGAGCTRGWAGLLFINFDEHADPAEFPIFARDALLERFGEVELFERYRLGELRVARSISYDVRANWKLVIENFLECYLRADAPGVVRFAAGVPGWRGIPAGARDEVRRGCRGVHGQREGDPAAAAGD